MKRNVGTTDRAIRIVLAIFLGILYFTNIITGTGGALVLIVAVILAVTAFVGLCPLYAIFGLNTRTSKAK